MILKALKKTLFAFCDASAYKCQSSPANLHKQLRDHALFIYEETHLEAITSYSVKSQYAYN